MNIKEAKEAIRTQAVVEDIENPDNWGVITCLSDDESEAYIKPKGMGFFRTAVTLDKIQLG